MIIYIKIIFRENFSEFKFYSINQETFPFFILALPYDQLALALSHKQLLQSSFLCWFLHLLVVCRQGIVNRYFRS